MKTFKNIAAQGDMLLQRIEALPDDLFLQEAENGSHILAHSETGHHHVVADSPNIEYYQPANDNFTAYLVVNKEPAVIRHLRSFDTHEAVEVQPGIYQIRRQREYTPEGFRRAID